MKIASKQQVQAVNITLRQIGQFDNKAEIIGNYTNQRTTRSSLLTVDEARGLLIALNAKRVETKKTNKPSQAMINKLFAMAHEMGWITYNKLLTPEGIKAVKDYSRVHAWVLKFGWKKMPLKDYTYAEMPKLVSIFEFKVYKSYLANINKR